MIAWIAVCVVTEARFTTNVASVSEAILAVCSCAVLPLFTGIGTKKTLAYISLVVIMATISGIIFGAILC